MSCELRNPGRDRVLSLSDDELLAECREDRARGSGRGGQKRNVTDSAVRLTHLPTGFQAKSDATRSQAQNRRSALRRLRRTMALEWRRPPPAAWPFPEVPGRRDPRYPRWIALVLDVLEAAEFRVRDAAAFMGLGTGRLVRLLAADPALWQRVNQGRRRYDLSPLRKPH